MGSGNYPRRPKPDIERYKDKEKRRDYLKRYREDPVNQARKRAYNRARYREPFNNKRMREANAASQARKRAALKPMIDEVRAQGCVHCGEKDVRCLQFHHRDLKAKSFEIGSYLILTLGRDPGYVKHKAALKEEMTKCDVVCANCHWKLHDGNFGQTRKRKGWLPLD